VTRRLTVGCEFVHESETDIPAVFQVEPLSDQKVDVIDDVGRWNRMDRPMPTPISTAIRADA
jgi:hypothetical protein